MSENKKKGLINDIFSHVVFLTSHKTKFFIGSFFIFAIVVTVGYLFNVPVNPFYGWGLFSLFSIVWTIFLFQFFVMEDADLVPYEGFKNYFTSISLFYLYATFFYALFFILGKFLFSPVFNAEKYADFLPVKEDKFVNVFLDDSKKIRKVTRETAEKKANKILGREIEGTQLSTQFRLAEPSIIKYKNGEYWIFPLTYSGFFKWIANREVPGYILVDAVNPFAEARFIKKPYKIATGYFADNVYSIAYFLTGFSPYYAHFEINEQGNPYWIVTKYSYEIPFNLYKAAKVYLINASDGKVKTVYNDKELKKNFPWVDKIYEEDVIKEYVENYGKFKKGFWNYVLTGVNVNVPCSKELWLIERKNAESLGWFTGMTSKDKSDNSLNYMVVVDSNRMRPSVKVIKDVEGVMDENGAVDTIDGSLGADATKWESKIPMPFLINGKFFWISSIVSKDTNYYIKEAAVKGDNPSVVLFGKTLEEIVAQSTGDNADIVTKRKKIGKKEILKRIKRIKKELNELKKIIGDSNVE